MISDPITLRYTNSQYFFLLTVLDQLSDIAVVLLLPKIHDGGASAP